MEITGRSRPAAVLLTAACLLAGCARAEDAALSARLARLAAGDHRVLPAFHTTPALRAELVAALAGSSLPRDLRPAAWVAQAETGGEVPAAAVAELWKTMDDEARPWPERLQALLALRLVDGESREALRRFAVIFGETYAENRLALLDGPPASAKALAANAIHLALASRLSRETPEQGVDLLLADADAAVRRGAIALELGFILSRDWERAEDNRGYDWRRTPEENAAAIQAWQAYSAETAERTRYLYTRERSALEGRQLPDPAQELYRRKNELEAALSHATGEAEQIAAGKALEEFLRRDFRQETAWVDYPGHWRPAPPREKRDQDFGWLAYQLKWSLENRRLREMDKSTLTTEQKQQQVEQMLYSGTKLRKAFGTPTKEVPTLAAEGLEYLAELRGQQVALQGRGRDATPRERYLAKQWALVLYAYDRALEQEHQKDYHRYHQMMHIFATTQGHDGGLLDTSQNTELRTLQTAIDQIFTEVGAEPDTDPNSQRKYPNRVLYFKW